MIIVGTGVPYNCEQVILETEPSSFQQNGMNIPLSLLTEDPSYFIEKKKKSNPHELMELCMAEVLDSYDNISIVRNIAPAFVVDGLEDYYDVKTTLLVYSNSQLREKILHSAALKKRTFDMVSV